MDYTPSMAEPLLSEFEWTLEGGIRLLVRPICSDDKQLLADAVPHISAENLYRRFFMPIMQLSDDQLRFLTEVDHQRHIAWCAIAVSEPRRPLAGVCRCVHIDDTPDVAEAAVLVVDQWQHMGIGTLLLALLAVASDNQGIVTLRSFALGENTPFLRTMQSLGAETHWEYGNVMRIDLPVYADPGEIPDTPRGNQYRQVLNSVRLLINPLD